MARKRVNIMLPVEGGYLLEQLWQPRWPENIGQVRLPGGKIEAGESPRDAVVRELREEFGIVADANQLRRVGVTGTGPVFELASHGLCEGDYEDAANPGIPVKLRVGSLDDMNHVVQWH